jgi:hypothetical protein
VLLLECIKDVEGAYTALEALEKHAVPLRQASWNCACLHCAR